MPKIAIEAGFPGVRWPRKPKPASAAAKAWRLLLHQRAVTLVERTERLVGRDRRTQLVVIVRALGLARRLDLEEVGRMQGATVDARRALAEERILGGPGLHLRDRLSSIVGVDLVDGFQVIEDHGIHAGMVRGRIDALVRGGEALRPRARLVVHVPVEGLGQQQALRGREAEAVDIAAEDEQARQALPALPDAELGRLLDRVDGVAAGVGQADHLGLRRLRLQQVGGASLRAERAPHGAEDLAAGLLDRVSGIPFECVAERVVSREEEPGIAAVLRDRRAGAVREHPGVVQPVDGVGRTGLAGEVGRARAGGEEGLVLVLRDLAHRERDRRGRNVRDGIDALGVVPLARDVGADVGLVLVVGRDDLHLEFRLVLLLEILDGELGRDDRAGTADVGVQARHVVQHADLHDAARDICVRRTRERERERSHHR
jgi:hypothetical protein